MTDHGLLGLLFEYQFKILISIVQYSSWPIAILIIVFFFKSQIKQLLSQIRQFKFKSIELNFAEAIKTLGFTEEQLIELRKLSVTDLNNFLLISYSNETNFTYVHGGDPSAFAHSINNLHNAGLVKILGTDTSNHAMIRHDTTELGKNLRVEILRTTNTLLRTKM